MFQCVVLCPYRRTCHSPLRHLRRASFVKNRAYPNTVRPWSSRTLWLARLIVRQGRKFGRVRLLATYFIVRTVIIQTFLRCALVWCPLKTPLRGSFAENIWQNRTLSVSGSARSALYRHINRAFHKKPLGEQPPNKNENNLNLWVV